MEIETLIFALIAALLLTRLWMVLGRRNEEDKERPNPFITPATNPVADGDASFQGDKQTSAVQKPAFQIPVFKAAPGSLAGGLEQIKNRDPGFNERQFLENVKGSFTSIVEDFAKGDTAPLMPLVTPTVLMHFQNAIEARHKAGQTAESKVVALKEIETTAARLDNDQASITVRFVSNQENILRDGSGQVIGGTPGKAEEITDLWTFTRNLAAADSNWLLAQTGS